MDALNTALKVFPKSKVVKGDTRLKELVTYWCEGAYFKKYGVTAFWGGAESKLLKTIVTWCDTNGIDPIERITDAMDRYLGDDSGFYTQNKHSFGILFRDRAKFLAKEQLKPVILPPEQPREVERPKRPPLTDEQLKRAINDQGAEKYAKGWFMVRNVQMKVSPELYERTKKMLLEMCGAGPMKQWFYEHEKKVMK